MSSLPYVTDTTVHTPVSVTLNLTGLFRKSQYVHNVYITGEEEGEEGNASLIEA
jgi:hypothetical protein